MVFMKGRKIWMSLCNQKISLMKNLRKHSSEVHEWKKPLKCYICDHIFSQNGSLKRHMLPVHDGYKTFKCELVITALQFTMLRNNLWPQFFPKRVIKRNTLVRFMKVRNLSHVIYLTNQSYSQKESLWRHISAIHWKDIFFQFMMEKPNYSNVRISILDLWTFMLW